jgi:ankyrin repeat protein
MRLLIYSVHYGGLPVVQLLCEQYAADAFIKDNDGETALIWAKEENNSSLNRWSSQANSINAFPRTLLGMFVSLGRSLLGESITLLYDE